MVPAVGNTSSSGQSTPSSTTPVSVEPVAGAVGGHPTSPTHDDAVLREKLRHMGKSKCCLRTMLLKGSGQGQP